MNDPELNAELLAVLGESIPTPQRRPAAAARPPDHGSDSDAALRQQIGAKKKLALQLRATDKPAAMQALREAKQLEAALKARPPPPTVPPPTAAAAPGAAAARRVPLEAARACGAPGGAPGGFALGEPESVTLSEADMRDPELLAELAAITGANPNPNITGGVLGDAASRPAEHGPRASGQRRAAAAAAAAAAEVQRGVAVEGGQQAGSDDELGELIEAMGAPTPPPPPQERVP